MDEDMLDDKGLPDVGRIRPTVMVPEIRNYYGFGEKLGDVFVMGRKLRVR